MNNDLYVTNYGESYIVDQTVLNRTVKSSFHIPSQTVSHESWRGNGLVSKEGKIRRVLLRVIEWLVQLLSSCMSRTRFSRGRPSNWSKSNPRIMMRMIRMRIVQMGLMLVTNLVARHQRRMPRRKEMTPGVCELCMCWFYQVYITIVNKVLLWQRALQTGQYLWD